NRALSPSLNISRVSVNLCHPCKSVVSFPITAMTAISRDPGDSLPPYAFGKVMRFMLDLAYVRENLPEIEKMLRRRGMAPATLLSGFRQLDEKRRALITQS